MPVVGLLARCRGRRRPSSRRRQANGRGPARGPPCRQWAAPSAAAQSRPRSSAPPDPTPMRRLAKRRTERQQGSPPQRCTTAGCGSFSLVPVHSRLENHRAGNHKAKKFGSAALALRLSAAPFCSEAQPKPGQKKMPRDARRCMNCSNIGLSFLTRCLLVWPARLHTFLQSAIHRTARRLLTPTPAEPDGFPPHPCRD